MAGGEDTSAEATTIAVAVRVYDSAQYVGEQLASILAQTVVPDQIVIGDDGSTDDTLAVIATLRETAAADPRTSGIEWVILSSEHVGSTKNILNVLDTCTAEVVVICDHDDRSRRDRLEVIRDAFDADPLLLLVHSEAALINADGAPMEATLTRTQLFSDWESAEYGRGEPFAVLVRRNIVTGATVALRRSLVALAAPVPVSWDYDEWYGIVAAALGRFGFIRDALLEYRQHGSNLQGVRARTSSEKLRMLLAHGDARNVRQAERANVLAAKLRDLGAEVPERNLQLAAEKSRHENARLAMPHNRLLRVIPVVREAASGAYSHAARGRKDILLDILQPRG